MERNKIIVIALLVLLLGSLAAIRRGEAPEPEDQEHDQEQVAQTTPAPDAGKKGDQSPARSTPVQPDVTKLEKTDLKVGKGKVAKTGDTVTVNYRGTLTDGTKFDASYDRNEPFVFQLGGQVIDGWNQGVVGMKEGGKRKLVIPSDMGYGPNGSPPVIPPNATLIFEIELLKVG